MKISIEADSLLLYDSLQVAQSTTVSPIRVGYAGDAREAVYPSSIALFMICGLALLAFIRYNFGKNLQVMETLRTFFDYRQALRMFEERREADRQATFFSNILFIWIIGIFITIALPFFGVNLLWKSYTLSVLFFAMVVGLLYLLKAGMWHLMGVVFVTQRFSNLYIYNMFLYNRSFGVLIFPFVAVIPYLAKSLASCVVYGILIFIALWYFLKLIRIFQIAASLKISALYFTLYLCILEIIPLLLFVKSFFSIYQFLCNFTVKI